MILNTAIFTATIETARTKCNGNAPLLRAINRAVIEIERAKYWSFADGVLTLISTTSGKRYVIDAAHSCDAHSRTCKHLVARRLMQCYFERLAAVDAKPATPPAPVVAAPIAVEKESIILRPSAAGFRVHPPYKHPGFISAFKRTIGGRWYSGSGEWFVPVEKVQWASELLGYWFGMEVVRAEAGR